MTEERHVFSQENPMSTQAHVDVHRQRQAATQAAFFLPHLRSGMSLLDCGCGPGTITLGLADLVAPATVIGIDQSAERVAEAREAAGLAGVGNVLFEIGDAMSLVYSDGSFDAVFENCVFMHLADAPSAAREILRVLRPGGIFGARDHDHDYDVGSNMGLVAESRQAVDEWRAGLGSNMRFGKLLPSLLSDAGFTDLLCSATFDNYTTPDQVEAVRSAWESDRRRPEFIDWVVSQGLAGRSEAERFRGQVNMWAASQSTFWAFCGIEVIGRKSDGP